MIGDLLLKGYKFPNGLMLNLQNKTVLTGDDNFIPFETFNMLENYFNRKAFSDYYLDNGTVIIVNGNTVSTDEFAVFRMRPTVNLAEELKISKKSILGQVAQAIFGSDTELIKPVSEALQANVVNNLNILTNKYGITFGAELEDIFSLAKVLAPMVKVDFGQEILQSEHDQYQCKAFLLDLIEKLELKKKKLLLVELPEYGLRSKEITLFLEQLNACTIDNIMLYTANIGIVEAIPCVFNYNVSRNGGVCGFDDYEELEAQLKAVFTHTSPTELEKQVIHYILKPSWANYEDDTIFAQIVEEFLGSQTL